MQTILYPPFPESMSSGNLTFSLLNQGICLAPVTLFWCPALISHLPCIFHLLGKIGFQFPRRPACPLLHRSIGHLRGRIHAFSADVVFLAETFSGSCKSLSLRGAFCRNFLRTRVAVGPFASGDPVPGTLHKWQSFLLPPPPLAVFFWSSGTLACLFRQIPVI